MEKKRLKKKDTPFADGLFCIMAVIVVFILFVIFGVIQPKVATGKYYVDWLLIIKISKNGEFLGTQAKAGTFPPQKISWPSTDQVCTKESKCNIESIEQYIVRIIPDDKNIESIKCLYNYNPATSSMSFKILVLEGRPFCPSLFLQ